MHSVLFQRRYASRSQPCVNAILNLFPRGHDPAESLAQHRNRESTGAPRSPKRTWAEKMGAAQRSLSLHRPPGWMRATTPSSSTGNAGERSGGTCCSSSTVSNLNGSATLPFRHPDRSGGIRSSADLSWKCFSTALVEKSRGYRRDSTPRSLRFSRRPGSNLELRIE